LSIVTIADMFGIGGRREELREAVAGTASRAAVASGCVRYTVSLALDEPDHVVVVSEWSDRAAMEGYYGSPAFATFQLALDGLLARPTEMTVYETSQAVRPIAGGPMDPRAAD
jgi:quinol monooxygenase YgiN